MTCGLEEIMKIHSQFLKDLEVCMAAWDQVWLIRYLDLV